jgi:hypothetical protein
MGNVLMAINQTFKTLSLSNQFSFACPVFGSETKIAACFMLRDMVWKGQKPPQRQGCQVCMAADKCPINGIIKDMFARGEDPYYSAEPKVGHLLPSHLAKVSNVRVLDMHLRAYTPSDRERELIEDANVRASAAGTKKAQDDEKRYPHKRAKLELDHVETRAPRRSEPKSEAMDVETAAAIAGDMSAAINREMAKASEPTPAPVEPPKPAQKPRKAPVAPETPPPAPITGSKTMSLLERARLAKEASQ